MKRLATDEYNALSDADKLAYYNARTNKMLRQQATMGSADALAPLFVVTLFIAAGIAYVLLH